MRRRQRKLLASIDSNAFLNRKERFCPKVKEYCKTSKLPINRNLGQLILLWGLQFPCVKKRSTAVPTLRRMLRVKILTQRQAQCKPQLSTTLPAHVSKLTREGA